MDYGSKKNSGSKKMDGGMPKSLKPVNMKTAKLYSGEVKKPKYKV